MYAEALEDRETERDQRNDREQRRVYETHRTHHELAHEHVPEQSIKVPQYQRGPAARQPMFFERIAPYEAVEFIAQGDNHDFSV